VLGQAITAHGYPAAADTSKINYPMTILLLSILVIFVTLVYAPIAAWLVELFPTRIRYSGLSLPYHIGNGWFGGFLPAIVFAIVAATGNIYSGLWYPIVIACMGLSQGGWEGRDTGRYLGKEFRETRTASPQKVGRASPSDAPSAAAKQAINRNKVPAYSGPGRVAGCRSLLKGEDDGSDHSREGQDTPEPGRGSPDRGRHRPQGSRAARRERRSRHRDHDGRQQAADPVAARSRTHDLTAAGAGYGDDSASLYLQPADKEKPRRGGVVVVGQTSSRVLELFPFQPMPIPPRRFPPA
jgi:hypothetical protein